MREYAKQIIHSELVVTVRTPSDKHGECTPRFYVTANVYTHGRLMASGCQHELILGHFPDLTDVVRLHLSDAKGVPMHAEANGWYWLAGCFDDGLGERYHGGNKETYGRPYNCREILSDHLRISSRETADMINTTGYLYRVEGKNAARSNFTQWVNDLSIRWAKEAAECEAKYGGNETW